MTAAVSAGDIERYEDLKLGMIRYSDQILEWLSFENGMTAFVMMVAALVCGISGFAWLNAKSKVDFITAFLCAERYSLLLISSTEF